jgi:hypothetical protein
MPLPYPFTNPYLVRFTAASIALSTAAKGAVDAYAAADSDQLAAAMTELRTAQAAWVLAAEDRTKAGK